MSEKKLGKRLLTWVLVLVMMLSLLPIGILAADGTDETAEDGEVVLAPVAGVEEEETAPVEDAPMLLAAPAAENTPTAVPEEALTFDKNKGAITGIDKAWLAANKDKPLSVTIPAEIDDVAVTSIGSQAFLYNTQLISVDLSQAAITEIGNSAFNGCRLLEEVTFPDTLTKIGVLAFDGCKSLKDVTFPDTLQTIGYQAFNSNEKLTFVDLSNTTVTTLGKLTFSKCTALREVILPSNLTELASSVFTDCKHIESIRLKDSPEGVVFALPETLTYIGKHTFKDCFADGVDAKVIIPASVETLGEGAFYDKHITQIIINKKHNTWYGGWVYDSNAIRIPDGTNCMIIFPDKSTYESFKGYSSTEQNAMTYPVEVRFFINYKWESEYHLNYRLLGYQKNATTGFWEFDDSYALPEAPASSAEQKPGYDYIGGWSGTDNANKAFALQNDEPLHVTPRKDGTVKVTSGQGTYVLQNPTISYLVDGKTENGDANQPFTVTIGDGKEHTLGVQVSHPLLLSEQGNEEDEYVYFEYCWWDEGYFADNGTAMTVNGPRSTEEPKLFSKAETNKDLHRVWVKDNTIPIKKVDHARTDHNYYLVEICGYIVKDGNPVRFYQSSNNFIQFGYSEGVATVSNYYTLQVEVVRVITATAGDNGKITPAGDVAVPKGESKTFTITPDSGYYIKDVLVDGKSVGAVSTYTFENVGANHTIHAAFAQNYTPGHPTQPEQPKVEIPDDDALGLNTTDHFAYIVGYGNGQVRPQNAITRAEVATIFFRLLTDDVREENFTSSNKYTDVAAGAWYNNAVSTLSAMGIITGYPDGTFRPNAYITRAEFAAIAARFDADGDKTLAAFSDIANHWAKDEISVAYNNGWVDGYPDGTFGPQRNITRAETVTLVNRVLNRKPETEDDLLPDMTTWTDNADKKAWYYLAIQEATNSHYYKYKENSEYEKWTELRETRDWTQLEK